MIRQPTPAALEAITKALEHPEFTWRTLQGIADELNTDLRTVRTIVASLGRARPRVLVRSSQVSSEGEQLYITVKHYRERVPVSQRMAAAIHNRVA